MSELFAPEEPRKLDPSKREDWNELVGNYWKQFKKSTRYQTTLIEYHTEPVYWKPPVPIRNFAFCGEASDANDVVKVGSHGSISVGGLLVRDDHVERFWKRIRIFLEHGDYVRACFRYKELIEDCEKTVQFYEKRQPDDIPEILAGRFFDDRTGENPLVPDIDGDKAPF